MEERWKVVEKGWKEVEGEWTEKKKKKSRIGRKLD